MQIQFIFWTSFLYTLKFLTICFKIASFEWLINLALEVGKYSVSSVPCDGDMVVPGFCQMVLVVTCVSWWVDNTWYLHFFVTDLSLQNSHEFEGEIALVFQYRTMTQKGVADKEYTLPIPGLLFHVLSRPTWEGLQIWYCTSTISVVIQCKIRPKISSWYLCGAILTH